jgi:alpha-mannosidase
MRAARLNQRLVAFQATPHTGTVGRAFALVSLTAGSEDPASIRSSPASRNQIAIKALKKAEDSDEIVVRVQELYGRPARAQLSFASAIASAREVNAAEEPVGPMPVVNGRIDISLRAYQPRTFAVRFAARTMRDPTRLSTPIALRFNLDGISLDNARTDGNFDGRGLTLAGEQWPRELVIDGVPFNLGPSAAGTRNVLVPAGGSLTLPTGITDRVYVLAAAVGDDVSATFGFANAGGEAVGAPKTVMIREWQGPVGEWYSPLKDFGMLRDVVIGEMRGQTWTEAAIRDAMVTSFDPATGTVSGIDQIRPAFVKRDEIAWVGTHRHAPDGNQIYVPSYVFLYAFDVPAGATALRLPANDKLRVFAVTAVREPRGVTLTGPLYARDLPNR